MEEMKMIANLQTISPTMTLSSTINAAIINDSLNKLEDILLRHLTWKDPLSIRLFKWGSKVLSINLTNITTAPLVVELGTERIEKLREKIVINFVDLKSTLKEPMLDRKWTWEKSVLENYLKLSSLSPFDEQPIQAVPHTFAHEILAWANRIYPLPADSPTPSSALVVSKYINGSTAEFALKWIQALARNVIIEQITRDMRQSMKRGQQLVDRVRHDMEVLNNQAMERVGQMLAVEEQRAAEDLSSITQMFEQERSLLHRCNDENSRQLQTQQEKTKNLESRCTDLENANHQLRAICQQRGQEVEQLHREANKKKKCNIM